MRSSRRSIGFFAAMPDERGRGHVAELRVDRAEHGGVVHDDLVGGESDQRPAGHRVVRDEHGHLPRVRAHGVRDLLGGEDEPAGRVQEQVDRRPSGGVCRIARSTASESSMSMKR